MTRRTAPARHAPESDLLKRLRRAVQISGLTADLSSKSASAQAILVTSRVAQTALDYLHGPRFTPSWIIRRPHVADSMSLLEKRLKAVVWKPEFGPHERLR